MTCSERTNSLFLPGTAINLGNSSLAQLMTPIFGFPPFVLSLVTTYCCLFTMNGNGIGFPVMIGERYGAMLLSKSFISSFFMAAVALV